MKIWIRRIIAVVGGLAIVLLALFWMFLLSKPAEDLFNHRHALASEIGEDAIYARFGDAYNFLGLLGLSVAAGLSFCLFLWDVRPKPKVKIIVYWTLLACVLPLAMINYWSGDIFMSRSKQAVVDLVLAFLSIVAVGSLISFKPSSLEGRILQAIAVFLLAFQGIFIPSAYGVLWLLNWERAISLADTESWNPSWISMLASVGSLIVAVLNYRRQERVPTSPILKASG